MNIGRREFLAALPLALVACPTFKEEPMREVVEKKIIDFWIELAPDVRFLYVGLAKGSGAAPRLSSSSCHENTRKQMTCRYSPEVESGFGYSLFIFEEGAANGNSLVIKLTSQDIQNNTFPKLIKIGKDNEGKLKVV